MISKIHNSYDRFTETEKKIADAILASPQAVINMSVKELAQNCGTVPSAIVRFCKHLDLKGFSELKLSLSSELGGRDYSADLLPVCREDGAPQVFGKVFASSIRTLEDTLTMTDFSQIEQILTLLQGAERIVFFGVGTSSVIAMDAQYRFAQLGIATSACTDILFMNVTAANLKSCDVAVCISHSGNTKATVNAMRRAKKAGAATVSISSFAHSRLAKSSDYSIVAFSDDKNYPVEAVSARIAHMCIIDALVMSLASQNYETLQKHIDERNEVLQEIRYKSK